MEDLFFFAVMILAGLVYIALVVGYGVFVAPFVATGMALYVMGVLTGGYAQVLHGVLVARTPEFELIAPYRPEDEPEPAYRQYFFGPALRDLRQVIMLTWQRSRARTARWATWITATLITDPRWPVLVTWPVGVTLWIGLVAGAIAEAVLLGVLSLLHGVIVLTAQLLARGSIGALRGADTVMLRAKGIHGMRCPWCHETNAYPSYRCPKCSRAHRDIRPGRHGVWRRRCICDERMPTLLMLGSYRMPAFCVYCKKQMSDETGRFRELVLPFFGGRAAGKTRLMAAMLMRLHELTDDDDMSVTLADDETRHAYAILSEVLDIEGHIRATTSDLPRAHSMQLQVGRSTRLVHIFDAAGERFMDSDRIDELRFLGAARTFIFVLDPMSVTAFWTRLAATEAGLLDRALASDMNPETVFEQSVQAMIKMGARLDRSRLAVAISKADLIAGTSILAGRQDDSQWARDWIDRELGLGNLIRGMNTHFKEVRFFFTAAVTAAPHRVHASIPPLVTWCLADRRRNRDSIGPGPGVASGYPGGDADPAVRR